MTNSFDAVDADTLADSAVSLVRSWLTRAEELETPADRATMKQLEGVVTDPDGVAFVMQFVDRVVRPDNNRVAAVQLAAIVENTTLPDFLSPVDKQLLRAGAVMATRMPAVVMPLARRRMRSIVGHLVAPAEREKLAKHLAVQRTDGYALNVNLLGEAVLGEREAQRRLESLLSLLEQPDIDYVSVKISAVASQLNHFAHADSLQRVTERLRVLVDKASSVQPPTFVNFDMEEYHDLDLTLEAFMAVLGEEQYLRVDAGIVLQAYLPDAFPAMQRLVDWANLRHENGGGQVKIRLVKGANLAMEKVDAAMHGWPQAPYGSKVEADANYKRCLDWLLTPERMTGVRLGLASHNLFDVAWTHLLAEQRGVPERVQFEMLQGMAPALAATVAQTTNNASPMLMYTPAVRHQDFDVAISYLFRRLEENASDDNFLRHLFDLTPDSAAFDEQERIFRLALSIRSTLREGPRRQQDRNDPTQTAPYSVGEPFMNDPETDPVLPANRDWIAAVCARPAEPIVADVTDTIEGVDAILATARQAQPSWAATSLTDRQTLLHQVADELSARRGQLISTMMLEANKTFAEADGEVAEAIDFARWYGDRALELEQHGVTFTPLGVIGVIPPWNFPVAIPAGGVFAALAAGNTVILKPAPETVRCAEVVAEACWKAGVPRDAMQFVRTPENAVGKHLITSVDGVILTGAGETADLFRSWKPDLKLFAETSGKNVLIITPNADIDLAVADLAKSAFGHSGQKCSAASIAILVGDVYASDRFRRQLIDAVESIAVGHATDLATTMGPLIGPANQRLTRGLTNLDYGEDWLVKPRALNDDNSLWTPGVRLGVKQGSWFHTTECFGPVLGLMAAKSLDHAIAIANSSDFGLTGGIHTLDPSEISEWMDRIEVGNGYVNRGITGAIVQRQPFGGWKQSAVGGGAKAGGPNYVAQLGTWTANDAALDPETESAGNDFGFEWNTHFSVEHDPTGLFCESNVFRYRPLARIALRIGANATENAVSLARIAAETCGVEVIESHQAEESQTQFAARLNQLGVTRVRVIGETPELGLHAAANAAHVHLATAPVLPAGRIELQHYVREQAMTRTLHRFGNLIGAPAPNER